MFSRRPRRTRTTGKLKVPEENDARLAEIEQEHIEAMELSRAAGQRPFPKQSQIPLFSRWRRHDYAIEAVKSVADRILTIDTKRNLKVCRAEDSRCLFSFQLPDFSCLTPYLSCSQVNGRTGREEDFSLLGVTLGNSRGALELVELPLDSEEPEVLSSHASHKVLCCRWISFFLQRFLCQWEKMTLFDFGPPVCTCYERFISLKPAHPLPSCSCQIWTHLMVMEMCLWALQHMSSRYLWMCGRVASNTRALEAPSWTAHCEVPKVPRKAPQRGRNSRNMPRRKTPWFWKN